MPKFFKLHTPSWSPNHAAKYDKIKPSPSSLPHKQASILMETSTPKQKSTNATSHNMHGAQEANHAHHLMLYHCDPYGMKMLYANKDHYTPKQQILLIERSLSELKSGRFNIQKTTELLGDLITQLDGLHEKGIVSQDEHKRCMGNVERFIRQRGDLFCHAHNYVRSGGNKLYRLLNKYHPTQGSGMRQDDFYIDPCLNNLPDSTGFGPSPSCSIQ